jgi:Polyketide cyclase / dehydrase and lipid transport
MESVIELEIDVPQAKLAALLTDPQQNAMWMDDVDRVETISGQLGMPGSKYRLVPKKGKMVFVATVLERNLPTESQLSLDASNVTVSVKATFVALSVDRTRLTSEEVFSFKGLFNTLFGFLARGAIKKAHRKHMDAFKRFAEAQLVE